MYFFILHLSVADLITAFLSVLPQLSWDITFRFQGGNFLCKVIKYGQTFGPYLSSYVLMATAVDRHQAICYPLTYCSWTSRRSKLMVYAAWITSLGFCIPQVILLIPISLFFQTMHYNLLNDVYFTILCVEQTVVLGDYLLFQRNRRRKKCLRLLGYIQ